MAVSLVRKSIPPADAPTPRVSNREVRRERPSVPGLLAAGDGWLEYLTARTWRFPTPRRLHFWIPQDVWAALTAGQVTELVRHAEDGRSVAHRHLFRYWLCWLQRRCWRLSDAHWGTLLWLICPNRDRQTGAAPTWLSHWQTADYYLQRIKNGDVYPTRIVVGYLLELYLMTPDLRRYWRERAIIALTTIKEIERQNGTTTEPRKRGGGNYPGKNRRIPHQWAVDCSNRARDRAYGAAVGPDAGSGTPSGAE